MVRSGWVETKMMKGDWECAACGYRNFSSRFECKQCGLAKSSGRALVFSFAHLVLCGFDHEGTAFNCLNMKGMNGLCELCLSVILWLFFFSLLLDSAAAFLCFASHPFPCFFSLQEKRAAMHAPVVDQEGFTLVQTRRKRKALPFTAPLSLPGLGVITGLASGSSDSDSKKRKRSPVHLDFYHFQEREQKREGLLLPLLFCATSSLDSSCAVLF